MGVAQITKADIQRAHSLLRQFDVSDRAVDIYIELLKMGPSSVQEAARAMKENRVTTHSAMEQLIEKGLIYETRKGKRRLLVAENPHALHQLLQQKENEITVLRANMDYVAQLLSGIQERSRSIPTVRFYEGVDGFKRMLEESLTTKRKRIYVFTYVDLFSRLLDPDYLEDYFRRRAKKGISTQLIFPPCAFAERVHRKAKEYRIQVRLLPSELHWKSGIFSWDDTIAIMSYTESKFTCTFIDNADIADFYQRIIFDLCWKQASPMDAHH